MSSLYKSTLVFFLVFLFFISCAPKQEDTQEELLIYCGITMIRPITEIKEIIEEEEGCHIEISKGGSGNLLKAIQQSRLGDLYLPGSESYIRSAFKMDLIADTATVGYNNLAVMVQKGNPLNIPANLNSLAFSEYYVIIGNPNSGSVGKATKKMLQTHGIFDEVEQNAIRFTTDSKDLSLALMNKEADMVVNWYATFTWDDNAEHMEILPMNCLETHQKKLILAELNSSQHPEIAKKFIDYATSEKGQRIFRKYGL